MAILHLSYDIADGKNSTKTPAVLNLILQTLTFTKAYAVNLERITSFRNETISTDGNNFLKIKSFGLPLSLLLKWQLKRAYSKLLDASGEGKINLSEISLIHSHKLTFEGYIGFILSKELHVPHFVTLRQTDFSIMKYRPDLRNLYREILVQSSRIYYLVPFMLKLLKHYYGEEFYRDYLDNKLVYLPNIINKHTNISKSLPPSDAPLLTILRVTKRSVARKNLNNLLKAFALMEQKGLKLKIVGDGDYLPAVKHWVKKYGIEYRVIFAGAVENDKIDDLYREALAFVMPSFSESFGLVYAESLLNGTPILYSKDVLGFSGIFQNVGSEVWPYSVNSIKKGLEKIIKNNKIYREQIIKLSEQRAFEIFSPGYAASVYKKNYLAVIKNHTQLPDQVKIGIPMSETTGQSKAI